MIKEFNCKFCNNQFQRQVFPSSKHTFDFCSPSCRNRSRELIAVLCPICGAHFKPHKINGADKLRKRYCSIKCAGYSKRGKVSSNPNTHTEADNEFVKKWYPSMGAKWCANELGYTKSGIANLANRLGVKLDGDIYKTLVHGAAKSYMTGEKNPNWQGGITTKEWGSNWIEQQKRARKRDNYTCQVCSFYSRHISVHHIKRRIHFLGHMEDANILSNLVCLCNKHHVPVEMGKIPCPVPKA